MFRIKRYPLLLAAALLAALCALGALAEPVYIAESEAQSYALAQADLLAEDVIVYKTSLSFDDGRAQYEVKIASPDAEYEFELDAATGAVLEWDKERLDFDYDELLDANQSEPVAPFVGLQAAMDAALNKAGLSADQVEYASAWVDEDDRVLVYKVRFYQGQTEYEVEIDAKDGGVREYDKERVDDD